MIGFGNSKKKAEKACFFLFSFLFFFYLNEKGEKPKNLEKFLVFTFSQLMK